MANKKPCKEPPIKTEILTQGEIDQLLDALNAGETDDINLCSPRATHKIKMYDFKRPDRFCREEYDSIQCLHGKLARKWLVTSFTLPAAIKTDCAI